MYGVPWQQQVEMIARATGRTADGAKVVAETEGLVADTAKANPGWAGKTITAEVFRADELLNEALPAS